MDTSTKSKLRVACLVLVIGNLVLFHLLAYLSLLHMEAGGFTAVEIDFWGRLTVYSLWFLGYELYRKYLT